MGTGLVFLKMRAATLAICVLCVLGTAQVDAFAGIFGAAVPASQAAFARGTGAGIARGMPFRPSLRGGHGNAKYFMSSAPVNAVNVPASPKDSVKLTPQNAGNEDSILLAP